MKGEDFGDDFGEEFDLEDEEGENELEDEDDVFGMSKSMKKGLVCLFVVNFCSEIIKYFF